MKIVLLFLMLLVIIGCSKGQNMPNIMEAGAPIEVYFCLKDNCEKEIVEKMNDAQIIHCAFFDLDVENLTNTLNEKSKEIDVKLVMDKDNFNKQTKNIPLVILVIDDDNQLMHNKFCIIDNKLVITGSFNPTKSAKKDSNNIIIITSKFLAENYEQEFKELWNKEFGSGKNVAYPSIIYNNLKIENYFCPEDKCAQHVIEELLNAKESIYFMTFAFTDENVADAILMSNVKDIKGVFDNMQAGQKYSQYKRMKEFGLDVIRDTGKGLMHHKVMIIDNSTVITGSYNPTSAADKKNDENILIIHDKEIAEKYLEEFVELLKA